MSNNFESQHGSESLIQDGMDIHIDVIDVWGSLGLTVVPRITNILVAAAMFWLRKGRDVVNKIWDQQWIQDDPDRTLYVWAYEMNEGIYDYPTHAPCIQRETSTAPIEENSPSTSSSQGGTVTEDEPDADPVGPEATLHVNEAYSVTHALVEDNIHTVTVVDDGSIVAVPRIILQPVGSESGGDQLMTKTHTDNEDIEDIPQELVECVHISALPQTKQLYLKQIVPNAGFIYSADEAIELLSHDGAHNDDAVLHEVSRDQDPSEVSILEVPETPAPHISHPSHGGSYDLEAGLPRIRIGAVEQFPDEYISYSIISIPVADSESYVSVDSPRRRRQKKRGVFRRILARVFVCGGCMRPF